ncbi:unknown [Bacteroides sp. CAG:702]|nr:unknown [Bacteroides sp. CAG:702]
MEVNKIINDIFKIVLNIILTIIAVTCSVQIFSSDFTSIGIIYRLVIVGLCVFTIFNKKYRYVGASLILLLILIAYLFHQYNV